MIKSWTDANGVTHYADEHSKAYRNRTEADTKTVEVEVDDVKTRRAAKADEKA
ncbi:DUF4124 domain-containing protein [Nocardia sp. NPDC050630]|uniref:DUF4124 domain-containing protein n=1 Tax=Nocardia sp. NPDC050630 TaxID=3364321 RepID=UPI0037A1540C